MSCVLRFYGKNLEVEKLTSNLKVKPYLISKKGDPVYKNKPNGPKSKSALVCFLASKAEFYQLEKQIKDATKYLTKNKIELKKIALNKFTKSAVLDFGIEIRIGNEVSFQFDSFPHHY